MASLDDEIKKEMVKLPFFIRGKDQIAFARHFAEWGAEHLRDTTKMIDKGLEEEMEKFFETMPVLEHENIFDVTFQKIARHFAEWQKEQMLKEAVEGVITNAGGVFGYDVAAFRFDDNHTYSVLLPHEEKRKYGDKVRIIIVKED